MKVLVCAGLLTGLVAGSVTAEGREVSLDLKETIRLAVENNLDVKAELYNPASSEADIRKFRGIYNPLLSLDSTYQEASFQSASTLRTGTVTRQPSFVLDSSVSQLLPTGGTVGLSFDNSWTRTTIINGIVNQNTILGSVGSYFQSNLTLNLSQPLLRNFGRETTELSINVAKFSKSGTLEQFRTRLMDIILQVRSQYFQLYGLRENLKVRRSSLALAEKILSDTEARVKAGVLPAMEILNAKFGVATQQRSLIDAERALQDQIDSLRLLLQLPSDVTTITPAETPFQGLYTAEEAKLVAYALDARPELRQLRYTLQVNELQSRVAKNQTLPQLDVIGSAGLNGIGQNYPLDLDRLGSARYTSWAAGLRFSYPLGNASARNDYIKSKLRVGQTETQMRNLEETVVKDVRTALRAVNSSYLQLDVTARGRAYAEEVLNAFIKKQSVGLATTKDVQDELNNLVTAQANEIQAVADYNKAITSLWRTTGELLDREGITLDGAEADALYEKMK